MKTRDIVIIMAIFYAIVIPASVIFMLYPEQEEKKHGLEIMMDKTVYKKGEAVEYTVKNTGDFNLYFPGIPIHSISGKNFSITCCHLEISHIIYVGDTSSGRTLTDYLKPGEYTISVKGATMNFTIIE